MAQAKVERNSISYMAAISAGRKSSKWQLALGLLSTKKSTTISYSSVLQGLDDLKTVGGDVVGRGRHRVEAGLEHFGYLSSAT